MLGKIMFQDRFTITNMINCPIFFNKQIFKAAVLPSKHGFNSVKKLLEPNGPDIIELDQEEHTIDLSKLNSLPQISFLSIKESLKKNLTLLEETHRSHLNEHNMTLENLQANKNELDKLINQRPHLDEQYLFYQDMKAYIRDFSDCYDEKLADIEKTESKLMGLLKSRADNCINKRQQEVRDLNLEATQSLQQQQQASKKPFDPAHQKRIAERRSNPHQAAEEDSNEATQAIAELNSQLEAEISEDFIKYDLIKARFAKWKSLSTQSYSNAYISLSLPKLFSPLVRRDLLDWNPLISGSKSLDSFKWFSDLITFNSDDYSDDYLLIPHLVEKTILVKLIALAQNFYDPMCEKQSHRFSQLVTQLVLDYPTLNHQSGNTKRLLEMIVARLRKTIDQEIYIPLYPRDRIEQRQSECSLFFFRQLNAGCRLFTNVLKWQNLLSEQLIKELALDSILNRYLMIGLQNMETALQLEKIEYLIAQMPLKWFKGSDEPMSQLKNMIMFVKRISDALEDSLFKSARADDSKECKYKYKLLLK
jgi:GC-rich sequence DNA-binding factor